MSVNHVNNRQDLLTDALLHHSSKVINNLAFRLKEKLSRATATVEESEKLLASTLEEEKASPTSVANWMTEWKQSTRKRSKKGLTLTVDEQYVNCLQQLKDHSNMLDKLEDAEEIIKQQEISRISRESKRLLKKCSNQDINLESASGQAILHTLYRKKKLMSLRILKDLSTERQYLSSVMKKYADGQGVGLRVSKQFSINTSKINKELESLNIVSTEPLVFGSVATPDSDVYKELEESTLTTQQQKAVELLSLIEHSKEEKNCINKDIEKLAEYFYKQSQSILETIQSSDKSSLNKYNKGKISFLYNAHYSIEEFWMSFVKNELFTNTGIIPYLVHEHLASVILPSDKNELDKGTLLEILEDIDVFERQNTVNEESSDEEEELESHNVND